MRHLHIVPLLVEEALRCCLELRNTLLQLLLAGAAAVETSDSKTMMADLYRRIHDTVCAAARSLSKLLPLTSPPFAASCAPLSGKASPSTWRTEAR
jgi:hypothetical protein